MDPLAADKSSHQTSGGLERLPLSGVVQLILGPEIMIRATVNRCVNGFQAAMASGVG